MALTSGQSAAASGFSGGVSVLGNALSNQATMDSNEASARAYADKMGVAYDSLTPDIQNSLKQQLSNTSANFSSAQGLGQAGNQALESMIGNDSSLNQPVSKMDMSTVKDYLDPSMAYQIQQGNRGLDQSAAAGGGLYGTGHAQAVEQAGQGLANTSWNSAYDKAYAQYNDVMNQTLQRQQLRGQLASGAAGTGLSAATSANASQNNAISENLQNKSNQTLGKADVQGQADAASAANPGFWSMSTLGSVLSGIGTGASKGLASLAG